MIYYVFAMKMEAQPVIDRLRAKKNPAYKRMDVFESDNAVILIMGTGMWRAVAALTELLSSVNITKSDFIINAGICGSYNCTGKDNAHDTIGKAYICNKLTSCPDGRTYYPDMLYATPFEERELFMVSKAGEVPDVNRNCAGKSVLIDMESAGIYEGAIRFVNSDQVAFIKIVSDICDGNYPDPGFVSDLVAGHADVILEWADGINRLRLENREIRLTENELKYIDDLSDKMRYSVTEKEMIKKQMLYRKVALLRSK